MVSRKILFVAMLSALGLSSFAQMTSDHIYFGVKGGMELSWWCERRNGAFVGEVFRVEEP